MVEKLLNPPAGDYTLPLLSYDGCNGSAQTDQVIFLRFRTRDERPGHQGELSISLPIQTLDATLLLGNLQQLQAKGLLPVVGRAPTGRQ